MQKILIYGYGWSGQSAFALFSALGFLCKVTDERISSFNTSLESFLVLQQDVLREEFDVVLVCIVDNEIAREVKEKLIKQGIKEEKIRFFQNYIYKDKMLSLVKNYFGSAEEVLSEILAQDLTLPKLNEKLQALLQEYHTSRTNTQDALKLREEAKRQFEGQNLFSILYELSWKKASLDHISYPGFNVGISQYKREDKNFYFIKKIDFASLRNRKKDLKLVACFGNSALRCEYLPLEETISHYLQEKLGDEFLVLNFGVTGYTLYEMMMLYNALVFSLKPEIVLSFFAGTDFRLGYSACEKMLKEHFLNYSSYWFERDYKNTAKSSLPLYCERGSRDTNADVNDCDIIAALKVRLEQFNAVVSAGGGAFLAFIQPLLPCKLEWHEEEKAMRTKEREVLKKSAASHNDIIDFKAAKLVSDLNHATSTLDYVFDLNCVIRESKEALFTNHWIHVNAKGNALCADYVARILQERGLLG